MATSFLFFAVSFVFICELQKSSAIPVLLPGTGGDASYCIYKDSCSSDKELLGLKGKYVMDGCKKIYKVNMDCSLTFTADYGQLKSMKTPKMVPATTEEPNQAGEQIEYQEMPGSIPDPGPLNHASHGYPQRTMMPGYHGPMHRRTHGHRRGMMPGYHGSMYRSPRGYRRGMMSGYYEDMYHGRRGYHHGYKRRYYKKKKRGYKPIPYITFVYTNAPTPSPSKFSPPSPSSSSTPTPSLIPSSSPTESSLLSLSSTPSESNIPSASVTPSISVSSSVYPSESSYPSTAPSTTSTASSSPLPSIDPTPSESALPSLTSTPSEIVIPSSDPTPSPIATDVSNASFPDPNKYYSLKTKLCGHNLCLNGNQLIPGRFLDGASFMNTCNTSPGQLWKFIPVGNGYYEMKTKQAGDRYCYEGRKKVPEATLAGAAVMEVCDKSENQMWTVEMKSDDYFVLYTKWRKPFGECLQANKPGPSAYFGGAAHMSTCTPETGQMLKAIALPSF